ncbi:MAG: tRNA 2-thiocytidine(32) synthetase TtcA, partial [Methylococcaceae bacterium]|nr:tRNA 2-thiocytidine(32) synthetase TtcA [Methylococcaceae bacterium]
QAMKAMLKSWDKQFPGRLETIFTSLQNVAPSQLADRQLFDFIGLMRSQDSATPAAAPEAELDILSL